MNKKLMAGAVAVVAMATFATVLIASAQTIGQVQGTVGPHDSAVGAGSRIQTMLDIGPKGHVFMRGTIASVSGDVITVNSWGGTWTVNVSASTKVLPSTASGSVASFKAGDWIGVLGTVSTSGNWTVNATTVRDRTLAHDVSTSTPASAQ